MLPPLVICYSHSVIVTLAMLVEDSDIKELAPLRIFKVFELKFKSLR